MWFQRLSVRSAFSKRPTLLKITGPVYFSVSKPDTLVNPFSVYTIFNFSLLYPDACTERGRTLTYRLVPACSKISNAKKQFTTILGLYIPPIYLYCYVGLDHNQVLVKMLWIKWRIFSDITVKSVVFLLCCSYLHRTGLSNVCLTTLKQYPFYFSL